MKWFYILGILDNCNSSHSNRAIVFWSFFGRTYWWRYFSLNSNICGWNSWWQVKSIWKSFIFKGNIYFVWFHFSVRGILGSFMMTFTFIGVMISYIAGTYIPYSYAPFVIMIFPIAFTVSFLILPESPIDLMNQKRFTVSLYASVLSQSELFLVSPISGCRKFFTIL